MLLDDPLQILNCYPYAFHGTDDIHVSRRHSMICPHCHKPFKNLAKFMHDSRIRFEAMIYQNIIRNEDIISFGSLAPYTIYSTGTYIL